MSIVEATAGFAHLDEKGRMPIDKQVRDAFGLRAGSTVAWVKLGDAIVVIPQDEHLADVMVRAASALESAGISVADLLSDLDEARDEVVTEHYGEGYFDRLRATAQDAKATGQ
jgi:bifunctional DNA-binding transcriptional regulator/antitoxin component of YhaV-PrlF toxin-antitoxin module